MEQLELFPDAAYDETSYIKFVDKFKVKPTTDDCFTPPNIYAVVLDYVGKHIDLTTHRVVRPFFPNGDYRAYDYPANAVVVDNPPFSIITEIVQFYVAREIKFFLFAPTLTLFAPLQTIPTGTATAIITTVNITYANGAHLPTSFLASLLGDVAIMIDPEFDILLKKAEKENIVKSQLPKYDYPHGVVNAARLQQYSRRGAALRIHWRDVLPTRALAAQRELGKTIFGGGFLVRAEALPPLPPLPPLPTLDGSITWQLSASELQFITGITAHEANQQKLFTD